jgi:acyl carrier protein
MNIKDEVVAVLDEVLSLKGRATAFSLDTPLLGALPGARFDGRGGMITTSKNGSAFRRRRRNRRVGFCFAGTLIDFVHASWTLSMP